jgi:hypothetical protein
MGMDKKMHQKIYRMREQGVDSTILNDVIQEAFNAPIRRSEDILWDDDIIVDDEPEDYLAEAEVVRKRYDRFRNVGRRHN